MNIQQVGNKTIEDGFRVHYIVEFDQSTSNEDIVDEFLGNNKVNTVYDYQLTNVNIFHLDDDNKEFFVMLEYFSFTPIKFE